jgi:2-hydroxy-3-keto-5-methylthiopentenyl-1-phosphate phosphatase
MNAAAPFEFYIDFDHTITEIDILDDIIQRFSINEDWKRVEAAWEAGDIGSRECLEQQFSQVRISEAAFQEYLRTIKVDPAFGPIVKLLRARGIEPVILSDSFTSIIAKVLEHNGVTGIRILSNEMSLLGDRPQVSFPYFHSICTRCGNCKTSHLLQRNRPAGTRKIYVGDGQSDICPAGFCEILFAKGRLLKHYSPLRKDCIPFDDLGTVHAELQRLLK